VNEKTACYVFRRGEHGYDQEAIFSTTLQVPMVRGVGLSSVRKLRSPAFYWGFGLVQPSKDLHHNFSVFFLSSLPDLNMFLLFPCLAYSCLRFGVGLLHLCRFEPDPLRLQSSEWDLGAVFSLVCLVYGSVRIRKMICFLLLLLHP